jgi:hypothetical protein
MKKLNLYNWIFKDVLIYDVNIGDDKKNALEKINSPDIKLVGQKDSGYYYLTNGYRFGFSDNLVDEIGIDFSCLDKDIELENNGF